MHAEASAPSRRDPKTIETACGRSRRFGNRVVTSQAVRQQHGNTVTWIENPPPDAVVFPQSTEDVQEIRAHLRGARVPIIPFGTGTSLKATSTRRRAASRSTFAT
jgi:D-lactate dehydrogenase (cytochrome)